MRHFVEYFDTRRMFTETEVKQFDHVPGPREALEQMPNYCSYFRMFALPDVVEAPASSGGVEFRPVYKRVSESGFYFPGGRVYSQADVEDLGEDHRILLSNMRSNRWDRVVQHSGGGFQPFDIGNDRVI